MDGYGNDVTMMDGDSMDSKMDIKITEVRKRERERGADGQRPLMVF